MRAEVVYPTVPINNNGSKVAEGHYYGFVRGWYVFTHFNNRSITIPITKHFPKAINCRIVVDADGDVSIIVDPDKSETLWREMRKEGWIK